MIGERATSRRTGIIPVRLVIIGLLALLLVRGIVYFGRSRASQSTATAYVTAPVTRDDVAITVGATGPITAGVSSPLTFKSSGRIAQILVRAGQTVTAGQVLASEDSTDLQAALEQAQADLAEAEASLASLQAGPSDTQRQVASVAVDNAKSAATDADTVAAATEASATHDVSAADVGVTAARTSLDLARRALAAARDQEAKILAADDLAVANAGKALDLQQATEAPDLAVLRQQLEKARDDLWSVQTSRDAACGQDSGPSCQSANANVAAAETNVNAAAAAVDQGTKQGALRVAQAQAQVQQARSQRTNDQAHWDATVGAAQGQIKQAQDALATAQGSAAGARAKATETATTARAAADRARGDLATSQASYDQTVTPPTRASLDTAQARIASARAAVDVAQANLDAATLRAPFAGTIASINGAVGQWVGAGSSGSASGTAPGVATTGLIQLMDLSKLEIVAQVNEADMARLVTGNHVDFTVNAFPGQTFTGQVTGIQPQGTSAQNVVTYSVQIAVDHTTAKLLPGMTANATIDADRRADVVVIPVSAITFAESAGSPSGQALAKPGSSQGGVPATVLVLANGKATPRAIQVGLNDGHAAEVLSGLRVGQTVVTGALPIGQSNAPGGGK